MPELILYVYYYNIYDYNISGKYTMKMGVNDKYFSSTLRVYF